MKIKATPMYLRWADMYLHTKDSEFPKQEFCQLIMKGRAMNYSTAEAKWKVLNAAYEVFTKEENLMRLYAADIESDGLLDTITKIWCMSLTELDNDLKVVRSFTLTDYEDIMAIFADPENTLVMHNGLSFDGPAAEMVFSKFLKKPFIVKAEIVDSLIHSWYLYPKLNRHGLDPHGEDLGISKPKVDDWSTQTLEVYVHRCEEDVKIQTALWRQMWETLHVTLQ